MLNYPKVVLVQVSGKRDDYWGFYPPLGLASVATYAMKYGKLPRKNVLVLDSNLPHVMQIIKSFKPDIIGFSTFSNNYLNTVEIAKDLRVFFPKALFIIGGVHISIFPETFDFVFDLGVVKEGEGTFLEIINKWKKMGGNKKNLKDYASIDGVVYMDGKKIVKTSERELIRPLDKIPPIDWSLFQPIFFRKEVVKDDNDLDIWRCHKVFPLFTSRGCPFHCAFCARTALWKAVRYFSEERAVEDIQTLKNKFGVTAIHIWDDLFTASIPRLKLVEKQLKKRKLLDKIFFFQVFARSDLFTPEMAVQLRKINVKSVIFGFETGSERILKYLKKDTVKVLNNYEAVELCEKEKISFVACLMMGNPTETTEDIKETIKFIEYANTKKTLQAIEVNRSTPFPGTELYDYAMAENLLPKFFSQMSMSLFLNKVENDKPLLIKDKQVIKSYRKYWKIGKNYEKELWLRMLKQKGHRWSTIKVNILNQLDRKLFLPNIIFDLTKRGNFDFLYNFVMLGVKRIFEKLKSYA